MSTKRKKHNFNYWIRKSHRYLGVFIGIQFLFWTLGGLYFSWTNIKEIRGDHLKKTDKTLVIDGDLVSPTAATNSLTPAEQKGVTSIELVKVENELFYLVTVEQEKKPVSLKLFSARDGKPKNSLTKVEAIRVATSALKSPADVVEAHLLSEKDVSSHHEIREAPLPAWVITFDNPANLTVYVAADSGQIISFRTTEWRIFDFLWMLHTMDFYGRDNINNFVLRAFSILGLTTIVSGFLLFFISSKPVRRYRRARKRN